MFTRNDRPRKLRLSAKLREIPEAELRRVTGGGGFGGNGVSLPNGRDFRGSAAARAVLAELFPDGSIGNG